MGGGRRGYVPNSDRGVSARAPWREPAERGLLTEEEEAGFEVRSSALRSGVRTWSPITAAPLFRVVVRSRPTRSDDLGGSKRNSQRRDDRRLAAIAAG